MSGTLRTFDCSAMQFDQWITFFFDRPVPDDNFVRDYTFFEAADPSRVIEYMTALFTDFPKLITHYTLPQINQAIWSMFGCNFDLKQYLFDRKVPIEKRLTCVRSMYHVYAGYVAKSTIEEMENCFFMWWDILGESFWMRYYHQTDPEEFTRLLEEASGEPARFYDLTKLDEDDWSVFDVMCETLEKILKLEDERTQTYALHGLGHLHHPKVMTIVDEYISRHGSEFTPEGKLWIEQCRNGSVM